MIHSFEELDKEFRRLIREIRGASITPLRGVANNAYEAVVCARVMNEYSRIYGTARSVLCPSIPPNARPGKFSKEKAFHVDFGRRQFYFHINTLCYGLVAFDKKRIGGDVFGISVVVIPEEQVADIETNFGNIPAPQHLHAAYQCEFAHYERKQLLALLGLRRHLSYLAKSEHARSEDFPFNQQLKQANPEIPILLFRAVRLPFFTDETSRHFEIDQLTYP